MTDAAQPPRHIQLLLDSQLAVFHRVARQLSAALRSREQRLLPPVGDDAQPGERRLVDLTRIVADVNGGRLVAAFERALEMPALAATAGAENMVAAGLADDDGGPAPASALRDDPETATAVKLLATKTVDEIDPVQLHAIEMRVGALQGSAPVDRDANPIGPRALLAAVYEACAQATADKEVRLALLNALQPHVALALTRAYDEVNIVLASEGVLPGGLDRPMAPAVPLGGESGTDVGLSQPVALTSLLADFDLPTPQNELDALVRDLIAQGKLTADAVRVLTDPSHPAFAAAMSAPADVVLLSSLRSTQGIRALALEESSDSLATLRSAYDQPIPPLDELTGRLVEAVLAFALREPELPRDVRREIARLQIMAYRAALIDRSLFTWRDHPFRQFVDGIVELGSDPANGTGSDGLLVTTLRRTVDALASEFADDLSVFSVKLAEMRAALDFTATPNEAFERAVKSLPAVEAAETARRRAREEVETRVLPSTPRFLANFLAGPYAELLATIRAEGADEATWNAHIELIDRLVWSVTPKTRDTVQQLTTALPGLIASLRETLGGSRVPAEARDSFMEALFVAHHRVMRQARSPEAEKLAAQAKAEAEALATHPPLDLMTGMFDARALTGVESVYAGLVLDFIDGGSTRRARVLGVGPEREMCALGFHDGTVWHRRCADIERLIQAGAARLLTPAQSVVARAISASLKSLQAS